MGDGGDGAGALPGGEACFVPRTLPGEVVHPSPALRRGGVHRAEALALAEPSPDRVPAPCPHFDACGGCALQHWADAPYAAWKRGRLVAALAFAGFPDAPVVALARTPPRARRRADLALRRRPDGSVAVGFHARDGGPVLDLADCAVLHPALFALVAPLRVLARGLSALRREGGAALNLLDSGPDLLLRTDAPLDTAGRAALARFAEAEGLPRIAWAPEGRAAAEPEIAAQRGPVAHALAGTAVMPPPGAFLQASREGEAAIVAAVLEGLPAKLPPRARVADLFAGLGTLSLPLAARARVAAFEGSGTMVAALAAGAGRAGLRVESLARDLARRPLSVAELAGFAAVVLDPPFAGAGPQLAPLAAAAVPRLVYVSCNPAALARDARVLGAAGWAVVRATPIDQFLWSPHLESVVVFARAEPRRRA